MTRQEHLLVILSEECAEVIQEISKALRFGLDEIQPGQKLTNSERIVEELCHAIALTEMIEKEGIITKRMSSYNSRVIEEKQEKVEKYLKYSKKCGTLK